MTTGALDASLLFLKPGISASPDDVLKSWNHIKVFSDTTSEGIKKVYTIAAYSMGFLTVYGISTLIQIHLKKKIIKKNPTRTGLGISHFVALVATGGLSGAFIIISRQFYHLPLNLLSRCVEQMNPQANSAAHLDQWKALLGLVIIVNNRAAPLIKKLNTWSFATVVFAGLSFVKFLTYLRLQSYKEQAGEIQKLESHRWNDSIMLASLGLACGAALCANIYGKPSLTTS